MSPPVTVLATLAGLALIGLALRDGFDSLFHTDGKGGLSKALLRGTWWVFHRLARRWRHLFTVAGPAALLVVLASWATLLVVGWALIFWPHLSSGFRSVMDGPGSPARGNDFVEAIYISLVTLGTVGFGDITPVADWLRVIVPLEALVGFALLTASISWLLSIYPALSRRRSLAYEISLLRQVEADLGVDLLEFDGGTPEHMYGELTSRLVAVERDMVIHPASYYFTESDRRFSLPLAMPYLLALAERGSLPGRPAPVRLRAMLLAEAIDDFARTTSLRFHGSRSESTHELLLSYACDHMVSQQEIVDAPRALARRRRSLPPGDTAADVLRQARSRAPSGR